MHQDNKIVKSPFEIGKKYFIRTVTYHIVGEIKEKIGNFLILKDASWVADSGRYMNAIKDGELNEVEPIASTEFVSLSAISDACEWLHDLPKRQK